MAIADITLLSGFQAETGHLDMVRCLLFLLFVIVILCTELEGASCHVSFFFSIDKLRWLTIRQVDIKSSQLYPNIIP